MLPGAMTQTLDESLHLLYLALELETEAESSTDPDKIQNLRQRAQDLLDQALGGTPPHTSRKSRGTILR